MKNVLLLITGIICMQALSAQLKTTPVCRAFTVDVLEGTVNAEFSPKSSSEAIKTAFPCSTSEVADGSVNCNGVFYKDKDISFYTGSNYIEIGEKFKGTLSLPLMGAARNSLFKWLGNPQIKDASWDAFQTKYGILILYYNKAGRVNKLQISTKTTDTIKLCQ
ncbi:hypothetical protein [Ferruginibacter sp.]